MTKYFHGPLRVCSANPRYFSDERQKAIYLTGSHTWAAFQDCIGKKEGDIFNYTAFLDFMQAHNHNFLRLWQMENAFSNPFGGITSPVPYLQKEKGKFDLSALNPAYFKRLRERVQQAGERGIYVSVMLFDGWSVDTRQNYVWDGHPYHKDNNINGIDGNPASSDYNAVLSGENDKNPFSPQERIIVHTLERPEIMALQKNYVRRAIETLNDLDNVLYEIENEGLRWTRYWQYEMVNFIKETESRMPKQHPVWMSHLVPAQNESLYISNADAISPGVESSDESYCINPPASDGRKVIITDTDHLGGIWGTSQWVWKSFLRGLNPIFMDTYSEESTMDASRTAENPVSMLFGRAQYELPENWQEPIRIAMGQTRSFAQRIDLTHMLPYPEISSTGYCLAKPGEEYLVYQPEAGQFKLRLFGACGSFRVEWFNPQTNKTLYGKSFTAGTAIDFSPPYQGEIILYLKKLL